MVCKITLFRDSGFFQLKRTLGTFPHPPTATCRWKLFAWHGESLQRWGMGAADVDLGNRLLQSDTLWKVPKHTSKYRTIMQQYTIAIYWSGFVFSYHIVYSPPDLIVWTWLIKVFFWHSIIVSAQKQWTTKLHQATMFWGTELKTCARLGVGREATYAAGCPVWGQFAQLGRVSETKCLLLPGS